MLVGGAGYSAQVQAASAQREALSQNTIANYSPDTVTLPVDVAYAPTRYDLTLDLSSFGAPTFALQMDVANRGDAPLSDLTFTLNHIFEVTDASVPYQRDGDDLTLHLSETLEPGHSQTISLTYNGAVWWYGGSYQPGRPSAASDFVDPAGRQFVVPALVVSRSGA